LPSYTVLGGWAENPYLDEPFALQLAQIDQVRDVLRILSDHTKTPLPQRLRSICGMMFLRLGEMQRELRRRPDMLSVQRAEEDQRSETTRGLLP
jgi:hypothetical protein